MENIELKFKDLSEHNGFMIWWPKQKSAARYVINLSVEGTDVAEIEKPRNIRYHSFANMPNLNYKVSVIAEDNSGNILWRASIKRPSFVTTIYASNAR